jgi:hypothetical protein
MKKRKAKKLFYRKWNNYVLDTKIKCDDCSGKILYFCKYDAEFCPQCNKWIALNCCDSTCSFCVDRPETPKDALAVCKNSLDDERTYHDNAKERAMRHYVANEKHKKQKFDFS